MNQPLSGDELGALIQGVFSLGSQDKNMAILLDVPDAKIHDNKAWQDRRGIAIDWALELGSNKESLGLQSVDIIAYPNVHSNNADLPDIAYTIHNLGKSDNSEDIVVKGEPSSFEGLLSKYQILLAPTEFSTTAPLKLLAKKHHFRAATMPGFSREMIPALRLDYEEINHRVWMVKNKLDPAVGMDIQFSVEGEKSYSIYFDLRYRVAHASGGRFPEPGLAGNLPSGECYIVPYEGERDEPSQSLGILPVQFEDEIVLYRIQDNRAVEIISSGPLSQEEGKKISQEPAYSNIAEIGFGVLRDFGLKPIGKILLDEKMGLHIAFGRSDHFGGAVGVKDFTRPDKVVHIDRIYIPETQDKVHVDHVILTLEEGSKYPMMEHGEYTIFEE